MPTNRQSIYLIFLVVIFSNVAWAGEREARRLRQKIQISQQDLNELSIQSEIKLPVTRGFHQKSSQLCWAFSTYNMLETNYLVQHPEASPSEVELSRWHMGKLTGSTGRRGVSYDALYDFIARGGMLTYRDYPDYGPAVPTRTVFMGTDMAPAELADEIIGDQQFWSYAFRDNAYGWMDHPDPDANVGTNSFFLPKHMMDDIIMRSLDLGKAVTYTEGGHIVQIYGAALGDDEQPEVYFIKDSYSPYFYEARASNVHYLGFEVTTVSELVDGFDQMN